jgi:hypothetical protein
MNSWLATLTVTEMMMAAIIMMVEAKKNFLGKNERPSLRLFGEGREATLAISKHKRPVPNTREDVKGIKFTKCKSLFSAEGH